MVRANEEWGHPWTVGPDIWFGVSDRVAVGIVHSSYGSVRFHGFPLGLCMNGESCDESYLNTGGRVLTKLRQGDFSLAAEGGILVWPETAEASLRAGIVGRLREGWFFLELNPAIHVGVNERDAGNTEELVVPVKFGSTSLPN